MACRAHSVVDEAMARLADYTVSHVRGAVSRQRRLGWAASRQRLNPDGLGDAQSPDGCVACLPKCMISLDCITFGSCPPRDRPLNTLGIILISDRVDCMARSSARAQAGRQHTPIRQWGGHESQNSYCICGLLAPRTRSRIRRSRSGDSAQFSPRCGLPLGCGCRHRWLHFSALFAHLTFPSGHGGLAAGASSRPAKTRPCYVS